MGFHNQLKLVEQENEQSAQHMREKDSAFYQIFAEMKDDGEWIFFQSDDQNKKEGDASRDQNGRYGLKHRKPSHIRFPLKKKCPGGSLPKQLPTLLFYSIRGMTVNPYFLGLWLNFYEWSGRVKDLAVFLLDTEEFLVQSLCSAGADTENSSDCAEDESA